MFEQYLARANEIIGERTNKEEQFDNEIIKSLRKYGKIRKAINSANKKYPNEALDYDDSNIDDIKAHYEYLMQHMDITKIVGN